MRKYKTRSSSQLFAKSCDDVDHHCCEPDVDDTPDVESPS